MAVFQVLMLGLPVPRQQMLPAPEAPEVTKAQARWPAVNPEVPAARLRQARWPAAASRVWPALWRREERSRKAAETGVQATEGRPRAVAPATTAAQAFLQAALDRRDRVTRAVRRGLLRVAAEPVHHPRRARLPDPAQARAVLTEPVPPLANRRGSWSFGERPCSHGVVEDRAAEYSARGSPLHVAGAGALEPGVRWEWNMRPTLW